MSKKYKTNRACRVNGSAWVFSKGDVLEVGINVPQYVIWILEANGYVDEVSAKKSKKQEADNG